MRIAAYFDILWKVGVIVLAMSPYRCAGQSVGEATPQLTWKSDYGSLFQSGHLLLKGDILHIEAKGKPRESYVIAVFPQYRPRSAPGNERGWRMFFVTPRYENSDYVLPGKQKIVCSWVGTPLLETADISATLFVPYDALSTDIADGEYDIRYLVTLQQNTKTVQRSEIFTSDYYLEVNNNSGNRPKRLFSVEAPAPPP